MLTERARDLLNEKRADDVFLFQAWGILLVPTAPDL